jgi:hypothetical protein
MALRQRRKGKDGELDLVHWLRKHDIYAERGAQHRGGPHSPDVVVPDWAWLHIEAKRVQSMDLGSAALELALQQSEREAAPGQIPVVFWRRNRRPWALSWRDGGYLVTICGDCCAEKLKEWAEERR